MVLSGFFTVVAVVFSLYAVTLTNNYEKLRIAARDNEDHLAKLERELTSLRQSWGQRWKQLEDRDGASAYDGMIMELIRTQLGVPQNQEK